MSAATQLERVHKVKIKNVKIVKELYPRFGLDTASLNNYRQNIENLPPIVLTKDLKLVDGYHRLNAYLIEGYDEIDAKIVDIDPGEGNINILLEAIKLNNTHGKQLTLEEKRSLARTLYTRPEANKLSDEDLCHYFAISPRTLQYWTKEIRLAAKDARNNEVYDLYQKGYTYEEIGKTLNIPMRTVGGICQKRNDAEMANAQKPDSLQIFDFWEFSLHNTRYGIDYHGCLPEGVIENFLYYFTEPFDMVVGFSYDIRLLENVCKDMNRRIIGAGNIFQMKTDWNGFPERCKECNAIFIDAPYGSVHADGSIEKFLNNIAVDSWDVLKNKGHIGFIIRKLLIDENDYEEDFPIDYPFDVWRTFTDLGFDMSCRTVFPVPDYESIFPQERVERAIRDKRPIPVLRYLHVYQKNEKK